MRLIIYIVICLGIQNLYAQTNLVSNGSFENADQCPNTTSGNLVEVCFSDWGTPGVGSPDYYSFCSAFSYYRPDGAGYGGQFPLSGDAFVGIYCFTQNQPEGREYIQAKLTEPIHPGVRYKVSFHVSLSDLSRYAISSIGAHFSHQSLTQNDYWVIDVEPQTQNPAGNIIADTSGWVLVTDTFVSRHGGGEEWLTIGNFNYAAESDTFAFQPPNPDMGNFFFSYYYIDDVSVIALDSVPDGIAEHGEENGFVIYPNPSNGILAIEYELGSGDEGQLWIFDLSGRSVYTSVLSSEASTARINLKDISSGLYMVKVDVNGETKLSEQISVIR